MNIKGFGKWDSITEMLCAVSRFKADWMKSSESKYYSVSWLCEESQRTVKAKVNGNAKRNHDVLYILAGQLCLWLPLRVAIVCVAVQGQKDWKKKQKTHPVLQTRACAFVMPDLHCFMQNSDGRRWLWSAVFVSEIWLQSTRQNQHLRGIGFGKNLPQFFPVVCWVSSSVLATTNTPGPSLCFRELSWLLFSAHVSIDIPKTIPRGAWPGHKELPCCRRCTRNTFNGAFTRWEFSRGSATQCFAKVCGLSWGLWVVVMINCTSRNKGRFFRTRSERGFSLCPSGTKEAQIINSGGSWCNAIMWHIGRFWASIPWKVQMLGFRFNRESGWEVRSYVTQVQCGLENRPL